ncbi:MAG: DNA polymerase III subunit gamma/tau [Bacteroidales bacterium]|nr:DNA polymerase III subunit gamma/tau [Bacteroidales bacterium]
MSENFIVSARKYRPSDFDSVVGQRSITTTLKNAIKTNQLAHAYLFCGPRGVGKTTCARIFAKTINCQNLTEETEACNECQSCTAFNSNRSMNIHELDAASNNSVEDIRKLIDQVRIPPQIGHYSVYIIDEVHMLSTQAFNAFLKTLEEPPEHAIFILATTEKHKILPTILSRCQIFDFNRIQVLDIVDHLQNIAKKEEIEAEPEALNIIAQKADGGLRDALSFFDQIASFSDKHITYEKVIQSLNVLDYDYYFKLTDSFLTGEYVFSLTIFNDILNNGFDASNFIVGLSEHFRDLLVSKDAKTIELLDVGHSIRERYLEQTAKSPLQFLLKGLDIISNADIQYKMAKNKRLLVELMLLKLSQVTGELQKTFTQQPIIQNQQVVQQQQNIQPEVKKEETKQEEETKKPEIKKEIVQEKQPEYEQKAKSKFSLPSVNQLVNGGGLKKEDENNQEEKKEEKRITGDKIVTLEQISPFWLEYAESIKNEMPRLASTLSEYEYELKDQTIHLKLSNETQTQQILKIKHEILNFINQKLDSNLKLEVVISDAPLKSKTPYTKEEKYEYLKEKNPELDNLKKQFRLFVD